MAEQLLSIDSSADDSPLHGAMEKPAEFARLSLQALSALSDEAVQEYIHLCATRFVAAQRRWEKTGNFADVGERDAFWCAEADALIELGSRPGAVARIKVEGAVG